MSSTNILGFVKSLVPSLRKSDIESDLEASLASVDLVLQTYNQMAEVTAVGNFKSKVCTKLIDEFYVELKKSGAKSVATERKNFAKSLVALFEQIRVNSKVISEGVQEVSNEVIVTHAMTAFKANVIRAVGHYYFMSRYALDLANMLYIEEAIEAKMEFRDEAAMNKKQKAFISENMWIFARLVGVYGEKGDGLSERMSALTNAVIPKEAGEEVLSVYGHDKVDIFSSIPQNFIGSPIYTVRLIFAQWEADRYIQMKDKKRLLELRLLHLRLLKENGNTDPSMEKEIGHVQRRVTDIDYKLAKIDSDVE